MLVYKKLLTQFNEREYRANDLSQLLACQRATHLTRLCLAKSTSEDCVDRALDELQEINQEYPDAVKPGILHGFKNDCDCYEPGEWSETDTFEMLNCCAIEPVHRGYRGKFIYFLAHQLHFSLHFLADEPLFWDMMNFLSKQTITIVFNGTNQNCHPLPKW